MFKSDFKYRKNYIPRQQIILLLIIALRRADNYEAANRVK